MRKKLLIISIIIGVIIIGLSIKYFRNRDIDEDEIYPINQTQETENRPINKDSLEKVKLSILKMRLDFDKIEHKFKYSNILEIDSSNSLHFYNNKNLQLTREEYYAAFQDSSEFYYHPEFNPAYYYSNQGEFNGYKRYIFAQKDETCCMFYYYNIYNKSDKKTGSFLFHAGGGDGGWYIDEKIKTINDSTFEQVSLNCQGGVDENGIDMSACDSIFTTFHLLNDGTVKADVSQLFKIKKY